MSNKYYVVSDLIPIKDIQNKYFQSQHIAYKYGLTIESKNTASFKDESKQEIQNLWDLIEKKYKNYTEIISKRLNKLHGSKYSNEFWRRVFSLTLLNQITVVHQFYINTKTNFDPNSYDCETLNVENYIIPNNFEEQRSLLISDFGQEQLFSIYIKYFYPNCYKDFQFDKKNLNIFTEKKNKHLSFTKYFNLRKYTLQRIFLKLKNIYSKLKNSKSKVVTGIMGSYFEIKYIEILYKKSFSKIQNISIPKLTENLNVNFQMRESISKIDGEMDDFDKFFFSSLKYLLPKYLLENFSLSIDNFEKELKKYQNLKYIVSESCFGSSSINLFRALGYEKNNIKTYYNQHNFFIHPYIGNLTTLQADLVDKYLTIGWGENNQKFKKLSSLFPFKIPIRKKKYNILYISYPISIYRTYYSSAFIRYGNGAARHLKFVSNFFKFIPIYILKKISYRAYPKDYFINVHQYNKELFLKYYLKEVKMLSAFKYKGETCKEQMASSSLIIIDDIGTSKLEALTMNIPTICFCDTNRYLNNTYLNFFDELIEAKIVHTTPQSAAEHLIDVHENPLKWWNSSKTQDLKNRWLNKNFGNPNDMIEYLLKLSKKN